MLELAHVSRRGNQKDPTNRLDSLHRTAKYLWPRSSIELFPISLKSKGNYNIINDDGSVATIMQCKEKQA